MWNSFQREQGLVTQNALSEKAFSSSVLLSSVLTFNMSLILYICHFAPFVFVISKHAFVIS